MEKTKISASIRIIPPKSKIGSDHQKQTVKNAPSLNFTKTGCKNSLSASIRIIPPKKKTNSTDHQTQTSGNETPEEKVSLNFTKTRCQESAPKSRNDITIKKETNNDQLLLDDKKIVLAKVTPFSKSIPIHTKTNEPLLDDKIVLAKVTPISNSIPTKTQINKSTLGYGKKVLTKVTSIADTKNEPLSDNEIITPQPATFANVKVENNDGGKQNGLSDSTVINSFIKVEYQINKNDANGDNQGTKMHDTKELFIKEENVHDDQMAQMGKMEQMGGMEQTEQMDHDGKDVNDRSVKIIGDSSSEQTMSSTEPSKEGLRCYSREPCPNDRTRIWRRLENSEWKRLGSDRWDPNSEAELAASSAHRGLENDIHPKEARNVGGVRKPGGRVRFKCDGCNLGFTSEEKFKIHERHHESLETLECLTCSKVFDTEAYLRNHWQRSKHHIILPFECPKCSAKFSSETGLNYHKKKHLGIKEYKCRLCPAEFITQGQRKKHEDSHKGIRKYTCEFCNVNFARKDCLLLHERTKHDWHRDRPGGKLPESESESE